MRRLYLYVAGAFTFLLSILWALFNHSKAQKYKLQLKISEKRQKKKKMIDIAEENALLELEDKYENAKADAKHAWNLRNRVFDELHNR